MAKRSKKVYYQGPMLKDGRFKQKSLSSYRGRPWIVVLSDRAAKLLGFK